MRYVALLILSSCMFYSALAQKIENGIYIDHNRGLFPKYAILTVENGTAQLETFVYWKGVWTTVYLDGKSSYQPQYLVLQENGTLSNENTLIQQKKRIKGLAKHTFLGRMKFKFTQVQSLPQKYIDVRNEVIAFKNEH